MKRLSEITCLITHLYIVLKVYFTNLPLKINLIQIDLYYSAIYILCVDLNLNSYLQFQHVFEMSQVYYK